MPRSDARRSASRLFFVVARAPKLPSWRTAREQARVGSMPVCSGRFGWSGRSGRNWRERCSRPPARKGEARARTRGRPGTGGLARRDHAPARCEPSAVLHVLRRPARGARLRGRADSHARQEPERRRTVGSRAVVQHRQRRAGGEAVPERPRPDRDPRVLRARRGALRLRVDARLRNLPVRQHLRGPRRAPPQSAHRRRLRRLHGHAAQRRHALGVERGPQQLSNSPTATIRSIDRTSRCASISCPES